MMNKLSDVHNIFEPKMPIRVCKLPSFINVNVMTGIIQCKVIKRMNNNKLYIITFTDNTILLLSLLYITLEEFEHSNYKKLRQINNLGLIGITHLHISYNSLFTLVGNLDLKDLHNYISVINEKN